MQRAAMAAGQAQAQQNAMINSFLMSTAASIYAQSIASLVMVSGKPDRKELRKRAHASKESALFLAEAFGLVTVEDRPERGIVDEG